MENVSYTEKGVKLVDYDKFVSKYSKSNIDDYTLKLRHSILNLFTMQILELFKSIKDINGNSYIYGGYSYHIIANTINSLKTFRLTTDVDILIPFEHNEDYKLQLIKEKLLSILCIYIQNMQTIIDEDHSNYKTFRYIDETVVDDVVYKDKYFYISQLEGKYNNTVFTNYSVMYKIGNDDFYNILDISISNDYCKDLLQIDSYTILNPNALINKTIYSFSNRLRTKQIFKAITDITRLEFIYDNKCKINHILNIDINHESIKKYRNNCVFYNNVYIELEKENDKQIKLSIIHNKAIIQNNTLKQCITKHQQLKYIKTLLIKKIEKVEILIPLSQLLEEKKDLLFKLSAEKIKINKTDEVIKLKEQIKTTKKKKGNCNILIRNLKQLINTHDTKILNGKINTKNSDIQRTLRYNKRKRELIDLCNDIDRQINICKRRIDLIKRKEIERKKEKQIITKFSKDLIMNIANEIINNERQIITTISRDIITNIIKNVVKKDVVGEKDMKEDVEKDVIKKDDVEKDVIKKNVMKKKKKNVMKKVIKKDTHKTKRNKKRVRKKKSVEKKEKEKEMIDLNFFMIPTGTSVEIPLLTIKKEKMDDIGYFTMPFYRKINKSVVPLLNKIMVNGYIIFCEKSVILHYKFDKLHVVKKDQDEYKTHIRTKVENSDMSFNYYIVPEKTITFKIECLINIHNISPSQTERLIKSLRTEPDDIYSIIFYVYMNHVEYYKENGFTTYIKIDGKFRKFNENLLHYMIELFEYLTNSKTDIFKMNIYMTHKEIMLN